MKQRGIPKTGRNRIAFMAWYQSEGGSAWHNPSNTTLKAPDSWYYNVLLRDIWGNPVVGVQSYPDAETGIAATCKTFDTPNAGYDRFENAMKSGERAEVICRYIGESSWGTGTKLIHEVWSWIVRVPGVLRMLERKAVAPY